MAAMTTRICDLDVSHRVNGRAIARTEINACMHAAITQYGMPAQSIRRGLPSGDGCHQLSALLAHAGRFKPLGPSVCRRSEEHTSELQSLMRISYAVFCLKKKQYKQYITSTIRSEMLFIRK